VDLYHGASSLTGAERVCFLDDSCDGDARLRAEVESLLVHQTSADAFIEAPALDVAARLMARDPSQLNTPLSGMTIANFQIREKLGEGGMGVVYEAVDTRLGRTVALKFLPATVVANVHALERFEREARAASALNHPNICTIYSVQDVDGQRFIEMERLDGQTLRERIAGGPLPAAEAVSLALQVIDGLAAAHAKGIVHRDLKPENVFCTARGAVKILDFGIAKLDSAPDADPGAVSGTASYMSPEQAAGQPVDSRTDLFSLGALVYEMATGRAAFRGNSSAAIRHAVVNDEPIPPRRSNPAISSGLERVILKALRKRRDLRYQRAEDMRTDFESLERRAARRQQRGAIAAGVLLLGLVAGGTFWYASRADDPFANVRVRQITHNTSEHSVGSGAISPDGRYVAYADTRGIHVQAIETGEARIVPQSANLPSNAAWHLTPGWLPNGEGFVANLQAGDDVARSSAWVIASGGPPRKVRDHAQALSVSPDGSWIAFAAEGSQYHYPGIWQMDPEATTVRKLFDADAGSSIAGLSWSPDGRRVVYLRADETGTPVAIETRDLVGGAASTIFRTSATEAVWASGWLRDGRLLFSLTRPMVDLGAGRQPCTHWQMRLDITGRPLGAPSRLAAWLPECVSPVTFSADGTRASYLQLAFNDAIYIADLDADGSTITSSRRFTFTEGRNIPSGWTSDHRSVVFFSDSGGRVTLVRQRADADTPQLIVQEAGIGGAARLTPDGAWVIYRRESRSGPRLMRVAITGGASQEIAAGTLIDGGVRCTILPASVCAIAERSADRRHLVFTSIDIDKGRGRELVRVDAATHTEYRWALSPDGTRIAILDATQARIHLVSLTGMPSQDLEIAGLNTPGYVSWTHDGQGLLVPRVDARTATLLLVDLQGNARVLWEQPGVRDISAIPSRDGRHLAIWVRSRSANLWLAETR
jgi:eukaryotic-like serine/threonine-protein kinase